MENYEKIADKYANLFPKISKQNHLTIIKGALEGPNGIRPAMTKQGFESWYLEVGGEIRSASRDIS